MGETHEVLTVGTKGFPRNTRCRASSALPILGNDDARVEMVAGGDPARRVR